MAKRPASQYRQSAALPFRERDGRLEVLLITSVKRQRWIVPKGIVEPTMTPHDSAAKEALEEAGVRGRIGTKSMGEYTVEKWGGVCRVQVYPLAVETELESWPEEELRKRRWVSLKKAMQIVEPPQLREIMASLPQAVGLAGD
jgi:8-oxo-dGTP pyrophosphatase MutT (NUDIX family)